MTIMWSFLVIQNASDQKTEMEKIKGKMAQEVSKIEERKTKIEEELKEVQVSCVVNLCSHLLENRNVSMFSYLLS